MASFGGEWAKDIMKKTLLLIVAMMMAVATFAQKDVTLRAGTNIPIKSQNAIRASQVTEGQTINFIVARDVVVDGVPAIPYGSMVKGTVTQAKKSSWWGTRGRLGISINSVILPDGSALPLTSNGIEIKGANRTALSVILFAVVVWPACFICGGKAEMPAGYEIDAQLASAATITVK